MKYLPLLFTLLFALALAVSAQEPQRKKRPVELPLYRVGPDGKPIKEPLVVEVEEVEQLKKERRLVEPIYREEKKQTAKEIIDEKVKSWIEMHGRDLDSTFDFDKAVAEYSAALNSIKDTPTGKEHLRRVAMRLWELSKTNKELGKKGNDRFEFVFGKKFMNDLYKAHPAPKDGFQYLEASPEGIKDYYFVDPKLPHVAHRDGRIFGLTKNEEGRAVVRPLTVNLQRGRDYGALLDATSGDIASQGEITDVANYLKSVPLDKYSVEALRANVPFLGYAVEHSTPNTWDLTFTDLFAQGVAALARAEVRENTPHRAAPVVLERTLENLGGTGNLYLEKALTAAYKKKGLQPCNGMCRILDHYESWKVGGPQGWLGSTVPGSRDFAYGSLQLLYLMKVVPFCRQQFPEKEEHYRKIWLDVQSYWETHVKKLIEGNDVFQNDRGEDFQVFKTYGKTFSLLFLEELAKNGPLQEQLKMKETLKQSLRDNFNEAKLYESWSGGSNHGDKFHFAFNLLAMPPDNLTPQQRAKLKEDKKELLIDQLEASVLQDQANNGGDILAQNYSLTGGPKADRRGAVARNPIIFLMLYTKLSPAKREKYRDALVEALDNFAPRFGSLVTHSIGNETHNPDPKDPQNPQKVPNADYAMLAPYFLWQGAAVSASAMRLLDARFEYSLATKINLMEHEFAESINGALDERTGMPLRHGNSYGNSDEYNAPLAGLAMAALCRDSKMPKDNWGLLQGDFFLKDLPKEHVVRKPAEPGKVIRSPLNH